MAQSAPFWPAFRLAVGVVPFTLGVDGDGGVIRYVETTDPRFATREGIRAGDTYPLVVAAAAGRQALPERGWASFVELPSGRRAAFVEGCGINDDPLRPDSRVKWLFQRIGYGDPPTHATGFDLGSPGSGFGGAAK